MTPIFIRGCSKCGRVVPAQFDLCDLCWWRWARDVLIFGIAATVLLVTLASWGAQ